VRIAVVLRRLGAVLDGMRPADFKAWRKSLGLSQKEAADALGLKNRIVQYYEKGERNGEKVKIPKHVRLACYALTLGVGDYHGPDEDGGEVPPDGGKPARSKRRRKRKESGPHADVIPHGGGLDSGPRRTT
jgi:transcriptional regulator with XRE-family HTH domain